MSKVLLAGILTFAAFSRPDAATHAQQRPAQSACSPAVAGVQGGNSASLVSAGNNLGFKLFDRIFEANSQSNVFMSPASAAIALDMLFDGARGKTARAMAGTLGLGAMSRQTVLDNAGALLNDLQSADPKVQLDVANSVWARAGVKFKQAFLNDARRFFGARVSTLDFASAGAPATINSWVSCATHGTITTMINQITADLVMLLFNAVYFHGEWTTSFDPGQTKPATFTTVTGDQVSVPMMSLTQTKFPYEAGSNFQAVALPYGSGRFDMVMVLPGNGMSLQLLAPHLSSTLWQRWTSKLVPTKIDLGIPKFTLSNDWNLKGSLSALGMGGVFGSAGNFTGTCARCKLSFVRQKTYLKVDEKGTTASAITGIGITATIAFPHFVADHPFLLAIRDTKSGSILFVGAVNNPLG